MSLSNFSYFFVLSSFVDDSYCLLWTDGGGNAGAKCVTLQRRCSGGRSTRTIIAAALHTKSKIKGARIETFFFIF